jgi:hypothetical protein
VNFTALFGASARIGGKIPLYIRILGRGEWKASTYPKLNGHRNMYMYRYR